MSFWEQYFGKSGLLADQDRANIPYVIQIKVEPTRYKGKRRETAIYMEKYCKRLRLVLAADAHFDNHGIVKEISYTPQFGQYPHYISIVGFYEVSRSAGFDNTTKQTTDTHRVSVGPDIGEWTKIFSYNITGSVAQGQQPTTAWNALVAQLITNLINATAGTTVAIEREDIKKLRFGATLYGTNYWSLPS